ncbi:hypothetical protein HPB50_001564 [Hyalomma asiaticum]|uniref:Uncharacterized protein n=1 Tax=Hyalomma asiaticum TaxID=266040 RepID=A0ACB7RTS0_HYAAI|nr:hypothetical protein HPB50_001564 [Hyalomma asiaticum]
MPPNLPREEQKIVIRPRGGLCLARLEADIVMSAVITAADVPKTAAKADTICTNPTQSIIVISTPDEERARYYASVRSLYIGGRKYETHAYCTAPHGTVKGVIRGVAVEKTAEDLHKNIVNQANPQALEAHRIGNTTSIVILTCGKIGHRADVCPTPEIKICFACGTPNPAADHAAQCKPRCKLCNGAHATGAEGCTNRWERRNAGSTFSSQDFPQMPPQQQQQQSTSIKEKTQPLEEAGQKQGTLGEPRQKHRRQAQREHELQPQLAATGQRNKLDPGNQPASGEPQAQMQEMNAKLNQLMNAQQQQQQATPTSPPPPQIQPRPPTPTENNTNSAMEVQTPVTTEANSAEPETIEVARTSEPAPKKRALQHARERRVNARLDSPEERQDRLERTMKVNYETLSQAIKATNDRLDATNTRLDTLVTPILCEAPSARTVGKGAGQGVCTSVKKNLTSIDHELLPNGAIEHTTVEIVTGKRKRRESTFIINVYSNPKHFQQKFRTLVHKA